MNECKLPPLLAAALLEAQRDVKAMFKEGDNKHHHFNYTTMEQLIDESRRILNDHGLTLSQLGVHIQSMTGAGGVQHPVVSSTLVLAHESGEAITFKRDSPAVEGKGRPVDKASFGALTQILGYAGRDLLLIPRDDDMASIDRRDDRGHDPEEPAVAVPRSVSGDRGAPVDRGEPESERRPARETDEMTGALVQEELRLIRAAEAQVDLDAIADRVAENAETYNATQLREIRLAFRARRDEIRGAA